IRIAVCRMSEEAKTYSIAVRLRRVVYEDAYVAVPVTDTIVKANDDGTGSIDTDVLFPEAIRISHHNRLEWKGEQESIEVHPLQGPLPEGRTRFDSYFGQTLRTPRTDRCTPYRQSQRQPRKHGT